MKRSWQRFATLSLNFQDTPLPAGAPPASMSALITAVETGDLSRVAAVLGAPGADVNFVDPVGWSALKRAASGGNRAITEALLEVRAAVVRPQQPSVGRLFRMFARPAWPVSRTLALS